MSIELSTISTTKFLTVTLLSSAFLTLVNIGLALLLSFQEVLLLIIPGIIIAVIIGHKLSKKSTTINLENAEYITINDNLIYYNDIIGYFKNENGLTQSALSLKVNHKKSIHIIYSNIGSGGNKTKATVNHIIAIIKNKNPLAVELEYQDIYVKQMNILRPIFIGLTGLVILADIIAIFALVTGTFKLPWQFFYINFLVFGLIPFWKKKTR